MSTIKKMLNNYCKNSVKKDGRWYEITLSPTLEQIKRNPFILNSAEVENKILEIDGLTISTYMPDDYTDDRQHACLLIRYNLPSVFENLKSYQWLETNKDLFNTEELCTFYCKLWNAYKKTEVILEHWDLLEASGLTK